VAGQDPFGVKVFHLLVGYLDAGGVGRRVEFGVDGQPGVGGSRGDGLNDHLVAGQWSAARQFIEMWENNRCSILFHLLVPGGRWHTVMVRPVAAASLASSVFHCRVRYPLEPPPSAQISNRQALGYSVFAA
jgi:hypothetical protein